MLVNAKRTFSLPAGYTDWSSLAVRAYVQGTSNPARVYSKSGALLSADGKISLTTAGVMDVWLVDTVAYKIDLYNVVTGYVLATDLEYEPSAIGGDTGSGSSSGLSAADLRKLAPWFKGGIAGKRINGQGDSTMWQMDPMRIINIDGSQNHIQDWFVPLRDVTMWNHGSNGAPFDFFVSQGDLDTAAAAKDDLYWIRYGLNDGRIAGAGLGLYGSPSNITWALWFQGLMQTTVTKIKAARADACIVFQMPNAATTDCIYMINGTSVQAMMDGLRLAYRGDPALGVPNPETFGENVLVLDTAGFTWPEKAMVSQNNFLQNTLPGGDGLHPTNGGYEQDAWVFGYLVQGPAADTILSGAQARQLAAVERVVSKGWQANVSNAKAVIDSGEYYPVYTGVITLNDFGVVDMGIGPVNGAGTEASGSDANGTLQAVRPAGLALDDVVVFGQGTNAFVRRVTNIGQFFLVASSIRWQGTFIDGSVIPTALPVGTSCIIYRHKYAHSTAARKNALKQVSAFPIERRSAKKNMVRFQVVSATVGSLTIRTIAKEVSDDSGIEAANLTLSATDRLCLAGVECSNNTADGDNFGLLLTGATFAASGSQMTITMAGVDFTNRLAQQGMIMTGPTLPPVPALSPASGNSVFVKNTAKSVDVASALYTTLASVASVTPSLPAGLSATITGSGTKLTVSGTASNTAASTAYTIVVNKTGGGTLTYTLTMGVLISEYVFDVTFNGLVGDTSLTDAAGAVWTKTGGATLNGVVPSGGGFQTVTAGVLAAAVLGTGDFSFEMTYSTSATDVTFWDMGTALGLPLGAGTNGGSNPMAVYDDGTTLQQAAMAPLGSNFSSGTVQTLKWRREGGRQKVSINGTDMSWAEVANSKNYSTAPTKIQLGLNQATPASRPFIGTIISARLKVGSV